MNVYLKAIITFWQIRRLSSYVGVGISFAHGQVPMYFYIYFYNRVQLKSKDQQGRSKAAPPSVLFPSSTFPPHQRAFTPAQRNSTRI